MVPTIPENYGKVIPIFFHQDPHILLIISHYINILAVSHCIVLIFISSEFIVACTVLKSYPISDFHIRLVQWILIRLSYSITKVTVLSLQVTSNVSPEYKLMNAVIKQSFWLKMGSAWYQRSCENRT